jgi:hypothetical protein
VLDDEEERDELSFETHVQELTSAVLGDDAYMNQKDYLKTTPKPEQMTVKQWINRLKNINAYLPLMQVDAQALSETDLLQKSLLRTFLLSGSKISN